MMLVVWFAVSDYMLLAMFDESEPGCCSYMRPSLNSLQTLEKICGF